MALHLITGYKGTAHIAPEDIGAFNAGTYGKGEYVLNTGNKFATEIITNNTFKILDGDAIIQGRHVSLKSGTYETITIDNGEVGKTRNDLVVIQYKKNSQTGVEEVAFVVKKGEFADSNPVDPEITKGDILSGGCLFHEMPLYRITVTEMVVGTPEPLFDASPLGLMNLQKIFTNHVVFDTYKGDGTESKFINLGFTPDAVYVARSDGRTVLHEDNEDWNRYVEYYGGLALKKSPCRWWNSDTSADIPILTIEENGFRVYKSYGKVGIVNHHVHTNFESNFVYIALRMTDI